jgi:hypothetical protein
MSETQLLERYVEQMKLNILLVLKNCIWLSVVLVFHTTQKLLTTQQEWGIHNFLYSHSNHILDYVFIHLVLIHLFRSGLDYQ